MSEEIRKMVQEGWRSDASNAENPRELLKGSVFEIRRRIDGIKHQFQNDDGSTRVPEAWAKNHGGEEAARAHIEETELKPFKAQKELLHDALIYVENDALPQLGEQFANIQYLNQVGGAFNYVAGMVLDRAADTVESVEQLDGMLHNFMPLFFDVSGWEYFVGKAKRRLDKKK